MPVQKKHSTVYTISVAGKTIPGIQIDPSKKSKRNYCHRKYLQYGTFAVLGLVVIIAIIMFFSIKDNQEEATPWYSKKMCPNVEKCSKSGYSKPPLLLISIDGFRRDYLDQPDWVHWLKKLADCGATARKVYPVYPSSTFPNHYTQVTGLYPIYHGIVDNWIWDKKIDKKEPVRMNRFTAEHFKGIPIWKHYMAAGGRANCFFWPGSDQHHCSEFVPYNGSILSEDRVAKVREWLNLPDEKRPGLVTLYFSQVDHAGHRNTLPNILESNSIKTAVKEMDQLLHNFFQALANDDIFNCVNIVIMSDHGMVAVDKMEKVTKVDDYIFVGAPVSKIYKNGTEKLGCAQFEEVFKILGKMGISHTTDGQNNTSTCHQDNRFLVTTDANRPARLHYSGSQINGDFIVEGHPGVVFTSGPPWKGSVHGYDYLYPEMQTIFFARGPSFRPGVILPPFQQIEYFNLFLDLLGLEYVANNGTVGIFDPAMTDPPKRAEKKYKGIEACPIAPNVTWCCSSPPFCPDNKIPQFFSSNLGYCYISGKSLCGKTVYNFKGNWTAVMEIVLKSKQPKEKCSLDLRNDSCDDIQDSFSLSADPDIKIPSLLLPITGTFMRKALSSLDGLQKELLEKTDRLYVLSGTTVDRNRDVIADNEELDATPTHFYRLYFYCKNSKNGEKTICQEKDQLTTLGFIFPLIGKDPNCLDEKDLLLYYSARLKDVETISGLELMLLGYTDHERAVIRTKIVDHL